MTAHKLLPKKSKRRLTPSTAQRRLVRLLRSDKQFSYTPEDLAQEVSELAAAGADVNLVTPDLAGATPLDYAAARNLHGWIAPLVRAGAKMNTGYKPSIEIALRFESPDAALELIACGARMPILPIDPPARNGNILHIAVDRSHEAAVLALIDQGFDLNQRDESGCTALMRAFAKPEIFRILVQAGADVHAVSDDGRAVVDRVIQRGLMDICVEQLLLLLDAGVDLKLIGPNEVPRIEEIAQNEHLDPVVRAYMARKQALQIIDEVFPQGAVSAPLDAHGGERQNERACP